jgi:hypothetical protein
MLAPLLASLLLSAAPRALPQAEAGLYVDRLDRLGGLGAFLSRAGERAAVLRPQSWVGEFHPLLPVDPTSEASLNAAGVDPAGAATVSLDAAGRMSCLSVSDPVRFNERARRRLEARGELWEGTVGGAAALAAKDPSGAAVAGVALRGRLSCAVAADRGGDALLRAASRAVGDAKVPGAWRGLSELRGAAHLVTSHGAFGLDGTREGLTVEARLNALRLVPLEARRTSPYRLPGRGPLLFVRAAARPDGVEPALRWAAGWLLAGCGRCDGATRSQLARALAPHLTGSVAVWIRELRPQGSLRTEAGRALAVRHAVLAELRPKVEAGTVLGTLERLPGASRSADGGEVELPLDGGALWARVEAGHLVVANDRAAAEQARTAIASAPHALGRPLEFALDPPELAKGLARIPLLEAVATPELAGLAAFSFELGPLLMASERIEGALWPTARGHRATLSWRLPAVGDEAAPGERSPPQPVR